VSHLIAQGEEGGWARELHREGKALEKLTRKFFGGEGELRGKMISAIIRKKWGELLERG